MFFSQTSASCKCSADAKINNLSNTRMINLYKTIHAGNPLKKFFLLEIKWRILLDKKLFFEKSDMWT